MSRSSFGAACVPIDSSAYAAGLLELGFPNFRLACDASIRCVFGGSSDLANGQKHSDGLGSIAEGATDQVDRSEAQGRIECDRIVFGIHDYTNTT